MLRAGTGVIALAITAVLAGPGPARAADNGSFAMEPTSGTGGGRSAFELAAAPGTTVRDSLTIRNETAAAIRFTLYSADAYDDGKGTFVLRGASEPRHDVGAWVSLPFARIVVPSRGTAAVPFTITVPASASAGDHAGGIVALSPPGPGRATGPGVAVRAGVGVRIYFRVKGLLTPRLRVTDVHYAPTVSFGSLLGAANAGTVTYRVVNEGNVRMAPTGSVRVTGLTSARSGPSPLPDLLPGGSATVTTHIAGVHGLGNESVTVAVASGATGAAAHGSAFVFPYLLVLVVVIAVGALIVFTIHGRRRRRTPATPAIPATGK
jgi:hypothetical protein